MPKIYSKIASKYRGWPPLPVVKHYETLGIVFGFGFCHLRPYVGSVVIKNRARMPKTTLTTQLNIDSVKQKGRHIVSDQI
ncbi:hypothetical protein DERF_005486 [Dermatophagoides farinae]|uniref:Uncharacterized protein n=1 Tax=Dermatophagoides farinae TaxID=6954 RepID=A0A922I5X7_DERFA|nr:hypothetical protein DERF_005486 [Dermatophagoides farinae]